MVSEGLGLVTVINREATFFGKDGFQSFVADAQNGEYVF